MAEIEIKKRYKYAGDIVKALLNRLQWTLEDTTEFINSMEDADVVEVKHGYNKSSMNPVDEFICSECGAMFADVSLVEEDEENGDINYYEFEFKYCPNCGARMDGGKEE